MRSNCILFIGSGCFGWSTCWFFVFDCFHIYFVPDWIFFIFHLIITTFRLSTIFITVEEGINVSCSDDLASFIVFFGLFVLLLFQVQFQETLIDHISLVPLNDLAKLELLLGKVIIPDLIFILFVVVILSELHVAHSSSIFIPPLIVFIPFLSVSKLLVLTPETLTLPFILALTVWTFLSGRIPVHEILVLRSTCTSIGSSVVLVLLLLLVIPKLITLTIASIYFRVKEGFRSLAFVKQETKQVIHFHRSEVSCLYFILWKYLEDR